MYFIVGLPKTYQGFGAIYTFVDRLTKSVHLVPTTSGINAKDAANLYIQNVFRLHGLSTAIVCDRDPKFTSTFFREVFHQLGTNLLFSTGNHPQTDGQTERMKKVVEDIPCAFTNHKQDKWDRLLPFCQFAINSSYQSSTCNTAFILSYGFNLQSPSDLLVQSEQSDGIKDRNDALRIAKDAIVTAQARQQLYADRDEWPVTSI